MDLSRSECHALLDAADVLFGAYLPEDEQELRQRYKPLDSQGREALRTAVNKVMRELGTGHD